jgi:hypothetical protein
VQPGLAAVLLTTAPLLVPADAARMFAGPVPRHGPACPGDELIAFLGIGPVGGDSERSAWSA